MSVLDKMTPERKYYQHADEAGYSWRVVTEFAEDSGWAAKVVLESRGMITEEAAVDALIPSLQHFIRAVKD